MMRSNIAILGVAALCSGAAVARAETNLLANPGFDHSLQGWTKTGSGPSVAWQSADADGSAGSGSARVVWRQPAGVGNPFEALVQCVPVTAGTLYSYSGRVRSSTTLTLQPVGLRCDLQLAASRPGR